MRSAALGSVLLMTFAAGCDCGGGGDDDDDADGGACPTARETGTVLVTVDGPGAIPIALLLTAADGTSESLTAAGGVELPAGAVTVSARRTRTTGALVGTVYVTTPSATELCVTPGETTNLSVTVSADPASGRLWVTDAGGQVLGLAASDLDGSGAPAPAAVLSGGVTSPSAAAMGEDGTLWVVGEGRIEGYANASLGTGGAAQPAVVLGGAAVSGAVDLAFDRNGALWVANAAAARIDRFDAEALRASGEPSASATVSGASVVAPRSIAFDRQGNLWVAGDSEALVRFDAGRLAADVTTAADLTIDGVTPEPEVAPLGSAAAIAFDPDGGLWAAHSGNLIARYSEANRLNPGEVTPAAQMRMPDGMTLLDLAIDEDGGVWMTGAAGQIARLGPDQLRDIGEVTPAVILAPAGLGSASSLALYPSASGSPIPY